MSDFVLPDGSSIVKGQIKVSVFDAFEDKFCAAPNFDVSKSKPNRVYNPIIIPYGISIKGGEVGPKGAIWLCAS